MFLPPPCDEVMLDLRGGLTQRENWTVDDILVLGGFLVIFPLVFTASCSSQHWVILCSVTLALLLCMVRGLLWLILNYHIIVACPDLHLGMGCMLGESCIDNAWSRTS